ncbi:MFS transporter [Mycobacterium sp.]|uniref:MFS transporter n=1 Tax=Mycobacterium sp. TaxID=1785 RepID=UPI0025E4FF41|nr:MFS transporter [Mycobacterium sp.]
MATEVASASATRRWSMLGVSQAASLCANVFINGAAFLIPALIGKHHASLVEAALLASMPNIGMMLTLIPWGYLLDRVGERFVLTLGLALTAAAGFAAASADSMLMVGIFLVLGGMAAASCLAASGRLVTGWFAEGQRAQVMGIRQTAQPLGIAVAALVIPELAKRNLSLALLFPAVLCALAAVACFFGVHDPPRPDRTSVDFRVLRELYRRPVLWRIHTASALLMVPQPVVLTFMLVWFVGRHGLSMLCAGVLVGLSQILGALGRVAVGRWSDRIGTRMGPLRVICVATAVVMVVLAFTDHVGWGFAAVPLMVVASAMAGDNGLPFTTIPELAGPFWSGWALATQNIFERLVVAAAPPLVAVLIVASGFPLAFAICAVFPLLALPLVPLRTRGVRL